MRPALIFDYDGVLHETMGLYRPAVEEAAAWLRREDPAVPVPGEKQFRRWIGMSAGAMWEDFLPGLSPARRAAASDRVARTMDALLARGAGRWYPGAAEMLDRLRAAGYPMAVLSSCREIYARGHWARFGMERWFSAFLAGETFSDAPKGEILARLLDAPAEVLRRAAAGRGDEPSLREALSRREAVMIGDRASDRAAAAENCLPFAGCAYGYGAPGELAGAEPVRSPGALPALLERRAEEFRRGEKEA